jgi:hypothetical protein
MKIRPHTEVETEPSARNLRTLENLCHTLYPMDEIIPVAVEETNVIAGTVNYTRAFLPDVRRGLWWVLWAFEYLTFPFSWRFKPFSSMTPEEQERYLATWTQSRFYAKRAAARVFFTMTAGYYFGDPKVRKYIGGEGKQ